MFLKYFIITGALMAIVSHYKYKELCKLSPIIERLGVEGVVLINFLTGFLNVWIVLPLIIRNYFLKRKMLRLERMIAENERKIKEKQIAHDKFISDTQKAIDINEKAIAEKEKRIAEIDAELKIKQPIADAIREMKKNGEL